MKACGVSMWDRVRIESFEALKEGIDKHDATVSRNEIIVSALYELLEIAANESVETNDEKSKCNALPAIEHLSSLIHDLRAATIVEGDAMHTTG